MTKRIECQNKDLNSVQNVRVRVLKAPFVNSEELKKVVAARARALVL